MCLSNCGPSTVPKIIRRIHVSGARTRWRKVAASIREYGWRQPVVVDADGVIVIGHLRRAAGRFLGETEVPVHVARDLTPAQIRGLRLADNRTNQETSWDEEALARELQEIKDLDIDLSLTGFNPGEIDKLLRSMMTSEPTALRRCRIPRPESAPAGHLRRNSPRISRERVHERRTILQLNAPCQEIHRLIQPILRVARYSARRLEVPRTPSGGSYFFITPHVPVLRLRHQIGLATSGLSAEDVGGVLRATSLSRTRWPRSRQSS